MCDQARPTADSSGDDSAGADTRWPVGDRRQRRPPPHRLQEAPAAPARALSAEQARSLADGEEVILGALAIHVQRPPTAKGSDRAFIVVARRIRGLPVAVLPRRSADPLNSPSEPPQRGGAAVT